MTDRIAVLPADPAYAALAHPIDGPVTAGGALWSYDGFTCRMLTDGAIIRRVQDAAAQDAPKEEPAPDPKGDLLPDAKVDTAPLAYPAPVKVKATGP